MRGMVMGGQGKGGRGWGGDGRGVLWSPKKILKIDPALNNVKLVHWPLMGGLLVQPGGDWAGCGPAQAPPRSATAELLYRRRL